VNASTRSVYFIFNFSQSNCSFHSLIPIVITSSLSASIGIEKTMHEKNMKEHVNMFLLAVNSLLGFPTPTFWPPLLPDRGWGCAADLGNRCSDS